MSPGDPTTCRDRGLVIFLPGQCCLSASQAQVSSSGPRKAAAEPAEKGPARKASVTCVSPLDARCTPGPTGGEEEIVPAGARPPVPLSRMLVVVRCWWSCGSCLSGGGGCDSRCSMKQSERKRSLTQED